MKHLAIVKELLDGIECPIHGKNPEISTNDQGELQLNCCCPKFKRECLFLIKKIESLTSRKQ